MKIAAAQLNPTIGAFKANKEKIVAFIKEAEKKGADLIVFPEMALTGYPPEDLLLLPDFIAATEKALFEIAAASFKIAILVGLPRKNPGGGEKKLYNSAALIQEGKVVQYFDKRLLPTYDLFDEKRYFEPGESPFCFTLLGKKVAVTICEDIWEESSLVKETKYLQNPLATIAKETPDLLLNLSASPYHFGKWLTRKEVVKIAAQKVKAPVLLVNQVGGMDSLIFDGYSLLMDPEGNTCFMAEGFKESLSILDLDSIHPILNAPPDPMEELLSALVLGLRDYFYKQGFNKACLGLSGGIDSALVLAIAEMALGKENLLAVLMPSPFSTPGSIKDAQDMADLLSIKTLTLPINKPYETFCTLLAPTFSSRPFDVTEENMQARIRGLLLMALSNKEGYIVLSTGNKSELAMGYSTLYGDLTGGLAIINDLTKEKVYALARHINKKRPMIPEVILEKEPSAELRLGQKDSDSLPPYPIIDKVLEGYVEKNLSESEIATLYNFDPTLVAFIIKKIHQSEYKRRQAPPGLRVTEKAFSIGRKFPIVQHFH